MSLSVLDHITLGVQPLWGRSREWLALQLSLDPASPEPFDAGHLLRTLREVWPDSALPLTLLPRSRELLAALLAQVDSSSPTLVVQGSWLAQDPLMIDSVHLAHRRGAPLWWRGSAHDLPDADLAGFFARSHLAVDESDALAALRAIDITRPDQSPLPLGQVFEQLPSQALAAHALDQRNAWALADWPVDDVLMRLPSPVLGPSNKATARLQRAVASDQSPEQLEDLLALEPVLAWRFLTWCNSAAVGLRNPVESIRHGLMLMGTTKLRDWLSDQHHGASTHIDVLPIKARMVLRAALTEAFIDAGVEEGLKREVWLCGLVAEADALLGEPLSAALERLPLSPRIADAHLRRSGPYANATALATAAMGSHASAMRNAAAEDDTGLEHINRALLRALSGLPRQLWG